jgi:hypothetical protein
MALVAGDMGSRLVLEFEPGALRLSYFGNKPSRRASHRETATY